MSAKRIDFYLVDDEKPEARDLIACRLLEKAYLKGHRLFVLCDTQKEAESLDELLWTFREDSFVPHNLQGEGPEPPPPIQIGYENEPRGFNDILLNLSKEIPVFYTRFKRIMHLVNNEQKELSRTHYKYYKSRGYELHIHNL